MTANYCPQNITLAMHYNSYHIILYTITNKNNTKVLIQMAVPAVRAFTFGLLVTYIPGHGKQ